MKKCFVVQIAVLLITGLISVTSADGILLGIYDGNDGQVGLEVLQEQINSSGAYTGEDVILTPYFKIDVDASVVSTDPMTVSYDEGNMTGTWETLEPIDFYVVKGGTQYTIWWIEESAASGTWTTEGLLNNGGNTPRISHLSSYNKYTNVSEPTMLSLLGISLLVIAGITRRRKIR